MYGSLIKAGVMVGAIVVVLGTAVWKGSGWGYSRAESLYSARLEEERKAHTLYAASLGAEIGALKSVIAEHKSALAEWQRESEERIAVAEKRRQEALAANAQFARRYQELLSQPPSHPETPCLSACSLLRQL